MKEIKSPYQVEDLIPKEHARIQELLKNTPKDSVEASYYRMLESFFPLLKEKEYTQKQKEILQQRGVLLMTAVMIGAQIHPDLIKDTLKEVEYILNKIKDITT